MTSGESILYYLCHFLKCKLYLGNSSLSLQYQQIKKKTQVKKTNMYLKNLIFKEKI